MAKVSDLGDRPEVRALLSSHADLLAFLTDTDPAVERGTWHAQLQQLGDRYASHVVAVRRAGLSVVLADGDTRREGIKVFVRAGIH
ncbi:hypothetical protein Rwratislav_11538 [Rhodococcus wratislaviensis IFP 2016]|nr:hypothetical protein Rwratislav_11538 [Rhodococcus wratislaviensis IFP 2016]